MKQVIFALLISIVLLGCEQATEPITESSVNVQGVWRISSGPISGTFELIQIDTILSGTLTTGQPVISVLGIVISRRIVLSTLEFMPSDPRRGQRTQGFDLWIDNSQTTMCGKYSLLIHSGAHWDQYEYADIVCIRD